MAVLFVIGFCAAHSATAEEPKLPEYLEVEIAVGKYFASLPDFKTGDLVSQKNVAAALDAVADVGWEVPNRDKIADLALADNSFIVRELATKSGRKFMRKLAGTPGAYERLNRLSTISGGEAFVRELIHKRGGEVMIEYLATTQGGHNLGDMMAGVKHGVDLNKPTGRIYTAEELMAVLKKEYKQAAIQ